MPARNAMIDNILGPVPSKATKPGAVRSELGHGLAAGAALILACVAIGSIAMPVASLGFDWERTPNEGWNVYHAARAAAGEILYAGDPAREVSYPFVSFYLIGWLKPLFGNLLVIGRTISVISLSCIAICSALIVRRLGGRTPEMLFGAAATLGFVHVQATTWIGTDDPQMLAEALTFGGLLCYLSGPPTVWRLAACALLCCAGGFTKPVAAAIPIAVTLDLLWRDRRLFLIWCCCGIGALALFAGLSYAIAGGNFLSEVLAQRPFSWERVAYHAKKFLRWHKIPFAASLIYLCQALPPRQSILLRACFAGALIVGALVSGGVGVSYNGMMELAAVMGIVTALAFGRWREQLRSFRLGNLASVALPLVIAVSIATTSPHDLKSLLHPQRSWETYELNEATFIELFSQHRFAVIELPEVIFPYTDEPDRISAHLRDVRRFTATTLHFTETTLRAIDRYYAPAPPFDATAFYLPKDDAGSRDKAPVGR